jgi:Arc/MetJ-type ribon-helix-helix transcriptional regulator
MSNTIVSVRIPESMVKELKDAMKNDHFLDLSEAVRGIVRKRWMEWKDPTTYQIKKLREDIKEVIKEKTKKTKQERLLDELERIKDMLSDKEVEK